MWRWRQADPSYIGRGSWWASEVDETPTSDLIGKSTASIEPASGRRRGQRVVFVMTGRELNRGRVLVFDLRMVAHLSFVWSRWLNPGISEVLWESCLRQ